jgi:steroid delta-isomerase-like uncharacterized protein
MATTDNASVVRRFYEALNAGDLDTVASLGAPGAQATSIPFRATAGIREDLAGWLEAFPDARIEVKNVVAQGDHVVAEIVGSGTHTGTLRSPTGDVPATGRHMEMPLVEVYRFQDGKIAEMRYYFDAFSFLQQLGVGQPQATAGVGRATPAAY